jgi:phage-related minor tail protein
MSHTWKEREDLAQADRHIAEGERRSAEQQRLIEQIAEAGQSTAEAKRLLWNFEETLDQFRVHRQLILDEMGHQEGSEP